MSSFDSKERGVVLNDQISTFLPRKYLCVNFANFIFENVVRRMRDVFKFFIKESRSKIDRSPASENFYKLREADARIFLPKVNHKEAQTVIKYTVDFIRIPGVERKFWSFYMIMRRKLIREANFQ